MVNAAMYKFLQPAQDLLSNGYTAIGLLENFEISMGLFQVALEIPGFEWQEAFNMSGVQNPAVEERVDEKARILRLAMVDPSVKKYLWLDFLLYEHAVSLHREQVDKYKLT